MELISNQTIMKTKDKPIKLAADEVKSLQDGIQVVRSACVGTCWMRARGGAESKNGPGICVHGRASSIMCECVHVDTLEG